MGPEGLVSWGRGSMNLRAFWCPVAAQLGPEGLASKATYTVIHAGLHVVSSGGFPNL